MATTSARSRSRAFPAPPIALLLVAAFLVGLFGASALSSALSATPSQTIGWTLAAGIGGPRFDPVTARTTSVVYVEVQWPACVETRDYSWLTPDVSYMPWSVTITLRTSDAYAHNPKCHASGHDSNPNGLPIVGSYLSALSFPVQLSESLAGRALFDGSEFPSAARPYR